MWLSPILQSSDYGPDPDNFRVFEDKVEQEIITFSSEDVPISIGVIFDCSRSMSDKFGKAVRPPSSFLRQLIQRRVFSR